MKVVRKYTSFEELTLTLLREFVEKIVIHELVNSYKRTGQLSERLHRVTVHGPGAAHSSWRFIPKKVRMVLSPFQTAL